VADTELSLIIGATLLNIKISIYVGNRPETRVWGVKSFSSAATIKTLEGDF
jgi:hypothetical protein